VGEYVPILYYTATVRLSALLAFDRSRGALVVGVVRRVVRLHGGDFSPQNVCSLDIAQANSTIQRHIAPEISARECCWIKRYAAPNIECRQSRPYHPTLHTRPRLSYLCYRCQPCDFCSWFYKGYTLVPRPCAQLAPFLSWGSGYVSQGGVALNITIETTTPRSLFPAQPLQIILALLICGFTVPPALHLSPYEKSYS
jgi:hypothetical protein